MSIEPKDELDRRTIERLDRPEPTNRDLADGLKLVLNRLWSKEDLRDFVQREQAIICEHCEKVKQAGLSSREKWFMGVTGTLIATLCGVIGYFIKAG